MSTRSCFTSNERACISGHPSTRNNENNSLKWPIHCISTPEKCHKRVISGNVAKILK